MGLLAPVLLRLRGTACMSYILYISIVRRCLCAHSCVLEVTAVSGSLGIRRRAGSDAAV